MLMVTSTEYIRQQNRALLLATMRERGPLSHTDLAEWTGLSSATVSTITTDLLAEEVIIKIKADANAASGRGRPRVLLAQNPDAAYIAVVRITSEEIEFSLADYAGTLKDRFSESRVSQDAQVEAFTSKFTMGLERLVKRSNLAREKLKAISITSKGFVASGRPVLLWSPVLGDAQIDFDAMLRDRWSARITLTNETEFAARAIANRRKIDEPDYETRSIATLSLGHNIGLGIATETKGKTITSTAPAFGHMSHTADGPLCRCGNSGCIESFAGFYAILRTAFEVPSQTIPANFVPLEEVDKIAENARRGDRMAQFAFRQAGEVLGIGFSKLISLNGPMPLVIIGPGLKYYDLMQESFEAPIKNNFVFRFGEMPDISLHHDQASLVYEGNTVSALSQLDRNGLARWN